MDPGSTFYGDPYSMTDIGSIRYLLYKYERNVYYYHVHILELCTQIKF